MAARTEPTTRARREALDALFRKADKEQSNGNYKKAFALFLDAAKQGDLGCQINLGNLYADGIGVKRDREEALYWYRRAYRRGDAVAASNIASLLLGEGELKRALYWFSRAHDLAPKDGDTELELAKIYLSLNSVALAKTCLRRAVRAKPREFITESGHDEALQLLAGLEVAPGS